MIIIITIITSNHNMNNIIFICPIMGLISKLFINDAFSHSPSLSFSLLIRFISRISQFQQRSENIALFSSCFFFLNLTNIITDENMFSFYGSFPYSSSEFAGARALR